MSGGPLKLSLGQALACRRVHHGHVRPRVATKSVNSTIDFRSDFVDMPFLLRGHLLENMRSLLLVNTAKSPWLPPRFYGFGARSFDSPPTPRAPVTPEKSKATLTSYRPTPLGSQSRNSRDGQERQTCQSYFRRRMVELRRRTHSQSCEDWW